jgi:uncharacterized membrane protein YcaP (DUF421 family)
MTFFDFCVAISLGSITANIGLGGDNSFQAGVTVLFTLSTLAIITGFFHIKSMQFNKLVNSEPLVLIDQNNIVEKNMRKARISLTELTALLRQKNAFNIADVNYAIMECDGKLSVLFKSDQRPATPSDFQLTPPQTGLTKDIIMDGKILYENLKTANLSETLLKDQLKAKGINKISDVFYAAVDPTGTLYFTIGIEGTEKHGQHGIE